MPELKKYRLLSLLGHIVFWLLSIGFLMLQFYWVSGAGPLFSLHTILKALIVIGCFAAAVYINLYLLIPRFLKQKNYIFYVFWLVLMLATISYLVQLLFKYPLKFMLTSRQLEQFNSNIYSAFFFASAFYVGITSFLKFLKDWYLLQDLNLKYAKIEHQKLEAELKTLKGQINPHFLFNSLNNIYSLALTKSDRVPDLILRLSGLMRHILYDARENFISLGKELEFVDNFISLQKIRITEKANITYEIVGEVPKKMIAPLLFEPFIDNAFKHGLKNPGSNITISIKFEFPSPELLIFTLENSYCEPGSEETSYRGIGLDNVKKRLKHLYKEDEYSLNISKKGGIFTVALQLKLKE
ncbi:MAG: hypothetical protein GXO81_00970 [Chlorobi bacterium]|nr:hypothetical protein [Chlorobiota bacterium]